MKRVVNFLNSVGVVLLTGFMTVGQANASTPDGETPAVEGICNILQGATPGLYGLCVAYCEAQDLSDVDKDPPNYKILQNYNKKRAAAGNIDPVMPCVKSPCPCWTDAELALLTVAPEDCDNTQSGKLEARQDATHRAFADINISSQQCRYVNGDLTPPVNSNDLSKNQADIDSAQVCYNALAQKCGLVNP